MNIRRVIKILGNIITVLAVIFIISRLVNSNFDYSQLLESKNILPTLIITIIQAIIVVTNTYPWKKLVELLTRVKLPYQDTITVYVKANLMKYVPGNVFQYVGRNELAIKRNIPHLKVATATILDVGMTVLSAFLISVIFLYDYLIKTLQSFNLPLPFWLIILIILIFASLIFVLARKKIGHKLSDYRYLLSKDSLKVLAKCLLYYVVVMLISSLMYMITLIFILNVQLDASLFIRLFSAYTLSWLVGFITPGAPAGIGIKEAIMVSVSGGLINTSVVALSMVILRILTTLADAIAFVAVFLFNKYYKSGGENDKLQSNN